jgi:hypothetical protein
MTRPIFAICILAFSTVAALATDTLRTLFLRTAEPITKPPYAFIALWPTGALPSPNSTSD